MVEVLDQPKRDTDDQQNVDKHCIFRCGDSWFALPALAVREATSRQQLFAVPHSHEALAGICHLRNEFLPALHLQALLGEEIPQFTLNGQMLVLTAASGSWALLIDQAVAIESLDLSINPDVRLDDGLSAALLGTAAYGDHVLRVLDSNSLYRLAEDSLRSRWVNEI